jgi:hypothetical protein
MKLNNVKTNNFNEIKRIDNFHKIIPPWKNINFITQFKIYV